MKLAKENLGKVSVTIEKAYHSVDKEYDKLVVVEEEGQFRTFISRKPVPIGTELTDREFWLPFSSVKESIVIDYNKFKQYIRTGEGLLDDSIVTRHIKDRNVTGDKIAEATITFVNIANEAVTLPKINKEAIDTTLTKEGYLAEAKHTGDRLLNIEGLSVIKVPSTQSTVLDAWQIIDKKGNVHGVTINTYKDKSIDAIWLSVNENDLKPENQEVKVDNPKYLNIIYNKADGTQQKVSIPLASFVTEAEFSKNGFKVIDGVVNLKISSDITTSRYFHFDEDGNITLDGFEERILEDLGTLEHSESGDGTMWGEFKKQETIREEVSNSAHQVFADNWDAQDDDPELPQDRNVADEASYAYNWKSTDSTKQGNLGDLAEEVNELSTEVLELESYLTQITNGNTLQTETLSSSKVSESSITPSNYYDTYYIKIFSGFIYKLQFNSDGVYSDFIQYGYCNQKPQQGTAVSNYNSYTSVDGNNIITITPTEDLYLVFSHEHTHISNVIFSINSLKQDVESIKNDIENIHIDVNTFKPQHFKVTSFIKKYLNNGVVAASNYYRLCYINVEKGKTYILKVSRETALRESKIGFFSTTPETDVEYTDEFVSGFTENENLVIYEATKDGILAWSFYNTDVTVVNVTVIPNYYINSNSSVYALKETSSITIYVRRNNYQYFGYVFSHRTKSFEENQYPSYFDNWGISNVTLNYFYNGKMYLCSELFTNGSEAELAFTTQDGNGGISYIGGAAHGFENIISIDNVRQIRLTKDCNPINEDDTFNLTAISEFKCCQNSSLCRAYTNNNIIASAYKNWTINENGLEFYVKLTADTNFDIGSGAQMGMLGVFRRFKGSTGYQYLTKYAIKENLPKVFDVKDGWANTELGSIDNNCYQLSEGGNYGLNFSMLISETNRDISGGMFIATNNSSYNKMYNQFVKQKSMVKGKEYYAKIKWIIS